jgi:hypothetical protein
MKRLYDYLFLKLYELMKKTPGKRTADDAALWLLVIALFFYSAPFLLFLVDYSFGKLEFWIWIVIVLLYGYVLYKINSRYFIDKGELTLIADRHKNESSMRSTMGFIAAITFELFSFIAFFLFLSFF